MISERLRSAAGFTWAMTAALTTLTALLAATAFLQPSGNGVAVIGDPAAAWVAVVRAGGLPVAAGPFAVTAISTDPGFAARLYGAGALLVVAIPDPGGCIGVRAPSRRG